MSRSKADNLRLAGYSLRLASVGDEVYLGESGVMVLWADMMLRAAEEEERGARSWYGRKLWKVCRAMGVDEASDEDAAVLLSEYEAIRPTFEAGLEGGSNDGPQ